MYKVSSNTKDREESPTPRSFEMTKRKNHGGKEICSSSYAKLCIHGGDRDVGWIDCLDCVVPRYNSHRIGGIDRFASLVASNWNLNRQVS